jgi:hypothetical protein
MKATFLTLMVTALIVTFLTVQTAIAQNIKPRELPGIKSEKIGEKETFVIIQQGDRFKIFNKLNTIMIQESRFAEMLGYGVSNPVKFSDKPKLDSLVHQKIMPFYKDFKSVRFSDDICSFDIFLYSGLDGKVAEIVFSIDIDSKLPLSVLEKLEKEILSSNFKLDFNKESAIIRGSSWVYFWNVYSVEGMKKRLIENEKRK